jgi:hypothetical protein
MADIRAAATVAIMLRSIAPQPIALRVTADRMEYPVPVARMAVAT